MSREIKVNQHGQYTDTAGSGSFGQYPDTAGSGSASQHPGTEGVNPLGQILITVGSGQPYINTNAQETIEAGSRAGGTAGVSLMQDSVRKISTSRRQFLQFICFTTGTTLLNIIFPAPSPATIDSDGSIFPAPSPAPEGFPAQAGKGRGHSARYANGHETGPKITFPVAQIELRNKDLWPIQLGLLNGPLDKLDYALAVNGKPVPFSLHELQRWNFTATDISGNQTTHSMVFRPGDQLPRAFPDTVNIYPVIIFFKQPDLLDNGQVVIVGPTSQSLPSPRIIKIPLSPVQITSFTKQGEFTPLVYAAGSAKSIRPQFPPNPSNPYLQDQLAVMFPNSERVWDGRAIFTGTNIGLAGLMQSPPIENNSNRVNLSNVYYKINTHNSIYNAPPLDQPPRYKNDLVVFNDTHGNDIQGDNALKLNINSLNARLDIQPGTVLRVSALVWINSGRNGELFARAMIDRQPEVVRRIQNNNTQGLEGAEVLVSVDRLYPLPPYAWVSG